MFAFLLWMWNIPLFPEYWYWADTTEYCYFCYCFLELWRRPKCVGYLNLFITSSWSLASSCFENCDTPTSDVSLDIHLSWLHKCPFHVECLDSAAWSLLAAPVFQHITTPSAFVTIIQKMLISPFCYVNIRWKSMQILIADPFSRFALSQAVIQFHFSKEKKLIKATRKAIWMKCFQSLFPRIISNSLSSITLLLLFFPSFISPLCNISLWCKVGHSLTAQSYSDTVSMAHGH